MLITVYDHCDLFTLPAFKQIQKDTERAPAKWAWLELSK